MPIRVLKAGSLIRGRPLRFLVKFLKDGVIGDIWIANVILPASSTKDLRYFCVNLWTLRHDY